MSSTGERLVALRERFGMSQAQVAATIGVDRTSYAKYEKDVNKPTRKLKELSDLFKVSSDYIMGLSDSPTRESSPTFNPPAGFFDDPEVGARVEQLKNNPKFRLLLCASKGLTSDELDSLIALAEHYAKKHGMTE